MKRSVFQVLAAGAVGVLLAFSAAPGFAKNAAECSLDFAANKASIEASGQTKRAFIAACRSGTKTIPTTASDPAAPEPAPFQPPPEPPPEPPLEPPPAAAAPAVPLYWRH
jgi:hypothetical protein